MRSSKEGQESRWRDDLHGATKGFFEAVAQQNRGPPCF